ncbi:MAG: hypothetical protein HPY59_10995 [Anaerolineae bacterium]|nr:hypothetical protein [Anaerolineae bacterium]
MSRRSYSFLFIAGIVLHLSIALLQTTPGYMDADYYFAGGLQLVNGAGFYENFLWNYLDSPTGIPHPSHTYWMPLPSLLAALGMFFTGEKGFVAARVFFILLAGGLPLLTARLAFSLTRNISYAWLAGILALFSGFYSLYLSNTESFSPYMVLGTLFLMVSGSDHLRSSQWKSLILGLLAGFMHLARADGALWLLAALGLNAWEHIQSPKKLPVRWRDGLVDIFLTLCAYFCVMGAWFLRNLSLYGSFFSPASGKAMWLTQYNDTFIYPADQLTLARWLQVDLGVHLLGRLGALWDNFKTVFAVQGEIFLFPLILAGLWGLRKDRRVRLGVVMWLVTLFVMTFVFPYAGGRGGMLHSGAAIQPLIWAVAPLGLEKISEWFGSRRGWDVPQAIRVFSIGLTLLSIGLTVFLVQNRVIGSDYLNPLWSRGYDRYRAVDQYFDEINDETESIYMVNNPPGFYIATGRRSIVIPFGSVETVLSVAARYDATFLILEEDTTPQMASFYSTPILYPGLFPLYSGDGFRVYRITKKP